MRNFTFYSPTEFVFGRKTEEQVGKLLKKYGAPSFTVVVLRRVPCLVLGDVRPFLFFGLRCFETD